MYLATLISFLNLVGIAVLVIGVIKMTIVLDGLSSRVGSLETEVDLVVSLIGQLVLDGDVETQAEVNSLTERLRVAEEKLAAARLAANS